MSPPADWFKRMTVWRRRFRHSRTDIDGRPEDDVHTADDVVQRREAGRASAPQNWMTNSEKRTSVTLSSCDGVRDALRDGLLELLLAFGRRRAPRRAVAASSFQNGGADARLLDGVLLDLLGQFLVLHDERQGDAEEPRAARVGQVHDERLERDDPGRRWRRLGLGLSLLGLGGRRLDEIEIGATTPAGNGDEHEERDLEEAAALLRTWSWCVGFRHRLR